MSANDTGKNPEPVFRKLLVANRGEIACRIVRTAKRMGIPTVAVFSESDSRALHVRLADESVLIGPPAPAESYLNMEKILDAAIGSGADAVHPGYGFLSENPDFADAVEHAGIIFIGPSASAIRAMGVKNRAKQLMEKAGVPVVPGYHGEAQNDALLIEEARRIGFPALIKPAAGGGGKGMRVADSASEFPERLAEARRESVSAFGSGDVIIERLIRRPRHIEVQIFGDSRGKVIHLFERDCTLQRRHQKIIEECPAPGISAGFREAVCDAAVRAASAIGYSGAGTVEFIADGTAGLRSDRFWFMEMNTRLQVEHPVTETALDLDLVEWQIKVAAGYPLPLEEFCGRLKRHAIEARIYAEDPANGFLPSAGLITRAEMPRTARIDTGVTAGDAISPFYDPMIAKIIARGETREQARRQLLDELRQTEILGVRTNLAFLTGVAGSREFKYGEFDTGTVERLFPARREPCAPPKDTVRLAAISFAGQLNRQGPLTGFSLWQPQVRGLSFRSGETAFTAEITIHCADRCEVAIGDETANCVRVTGGWRIDGRDVEATVLKKGGAVHVFQDGIWEFVPVDMLDFVAAGSTGCNSVRAPMPGLVRSVLVAAGHRAAAGDTLAVMEAMKMELNISVPRDCTVKDVFVKEGGQVAAGELLVQLDGDSAAQP